MAKKTSLNILGLWRIENGLKIVENLLINTGPYLQNWKTGKKFAQNLLKDPGSCLKLKNVIEIAKNFIKYPGSFLKIEKS